MNKTNKKRIILMTVIILSSLIAGIVIQHKETQYRSFFVQKASLGQEENSSSVNADTESENQLVNINTDNPKELETLNGIGEKMAQRIIDYRTEHGDFEVIEDIMRVNGIGEKKFEAIKDFIYIPE